MSLLEATSPGFHYGFPSPIVPLNYHTHFCLYNRVLRVPVWVMGQIHQGTITKETARKDEFHMDHSLDEVDQCDPKAYAEHNKNCDEDEKVDLGHGFASQNRRQSALQQNAIDVITNVWPEKKVANRIVKNNLESRVIDLANHEHTRRLVVFNGPGFYTDEPIDWLQSYSYNGCAIPHFSWMHIQRETPTQLQFYSVLIENLSDRADMQWLSADGLSKKLGYELAPNANSGTAYAAKQKVNELPE